ncbi:MAG: hypothetical protein AAB522_00180 [Patescibacteria group bacterium]
MAQQFGLDKSILMMDVLQAHAMEIRDVERGEKPFLYSSGNYGPGYVTIKNLVGRKRIIRSLSRELASKVAYTTSNINFVAGNVTGGLVPGWLLSEYLEEYWERRIPFVYVRDMRKRGGHKELITGITNNPEIKQGDNCLVVEELVNFAETTVNSTLELRSVGYRITHAACILSYNNPVAIKSLEENNIELLYLFTLSELLDAAEKFQTHEKKLIDSYREFLKNPLGWQKKRNLTPQKEGGTK